MANLLKHKGVVAAGHEGTAGAAAEVLAAGGNAFDAVVAGLAAACVCEPIFASPGGGGFLMAYDERSKKTRLYDFFAQTPMQKRPLDEIEFYAIHADFGPATQEFHIGAGAAAMPGFVPGLFAIHDDLCRMPMDTLLTPATRMARNGVTINEFQAYLFTVIRPILTGRDEVRQYYAPSGDLLKAGDIFRNHELANTFEQLSSEGVDLFINGTVAKTMLAESERYGGFLTKQDFDSFQVERRRPMECNISESVIALNPPPAASGALLAFGFGLIDHINDKGVLSAIDMAHVQCATNDARESCNGSIEGFNPSEQLSLHLEKLQELRPAYRGTTHISVIDAEGNAASATVTNGETNGRVVEGCGFSMNNMLGEEDINPQGFNQWTPNQRLSTMMAPTIIRKDDGTLIALGSGGSNRIRTAILQVAHRLIENEPLERAIAAPRMHIEKCGTVNFEDTFPQHDRDALTTAFPDAKAWPDANMFFGGVHTVRRLPDGTLEGAGDARRAGVSMLVE